MRRLLAALLALVVVAPAPASAAAVSYVLADIHTGMVVEAENAHQVWYPASLAKLMTAHLVLRALALGALMQNSPVTISENAAAEPPSEMGYAVGTVITVDNALKMMLVKSANDIAMALAETVGGSESGFVAMMNTEARQLGMLSTRFLNPNGLPSSGQVTTARDLAILARAIWLEHPQYLSYFNIPAILAGGTVFPSQNDLLERYPGATGMKTGFICSSGYNLVALAERNGRSLIAVVLGAISAEERSRTAAALLDRGFEASNPLRVGLTLDGFEGISPQTQPTDMRNVVCASGIGAEGNADSATDDPNSTLGPRISIMQPVPVGPGGADENAPLLALGIPLPRPKPAVGAFPPAAVPPGAVGAPPGAVVPIGAPIPLVPMP